MKTMLQGWKKMCINTITNAHIHQQQLEGQQQQAQNMSHSDTAANQRY
jgi:DNA replication protein DnaD